MRKFPFRLVVLVCFACTSADARTLRHHVVHRAPRVTVEQAPEVSRQSQPSYETLPAGAVTSGGCLSQGPADRNPCDPWYFKRVNPLIGGSYGD